MKDYKYDIAISFAGEKRKYALELAKKFEQCGLKVFYDNWNTGDMWGKNLAEYLSEIYAKDALYAVCIFSKEYLEKKWTQYEFEQAMQRQLNENEYILPIIIEDNIQPKAWLANRGYIKSEEYSIDEIALMVRNKVYENKKEEIDIPVVDFKKHNMEITSENGTKEVVEVILAFIFKDINKEYVIYTKNEKDEHGNTTVYVSLVDRSEESPKLLGIEDELEWNRIKEVLVELSAEEGKNPFPIHPPFYDLDGNEIL